MTVVHSFLMLLGPFTSALLDGLKYDTLEMMVEAHDWQFDQGYLLPTDVMALFMFC